MVEEQEEGQLVNRDIPLSVNIGFPYRLSTYGFMDLKKPHLNPIEHVWNIYWGSILSNLHNLSQILVQLIYEVQIARNEVPQAVIDHFISSLSRSIQEYTQLRDRQTHYFLLYYKLFFLDVEFTSVIIEYK